MKFEGDITVIDAIKEKKQCMDAGSTYEHIKPLVIVDGGFIKGAYAVGAGLAFEELGYNDVFSSIVGVSGGAASASYFLSSEVYKGAGLMYEECCTKEFFDLWRLRQQVNTQFIIDAMRPGGDKEISADKVLASPTELYIGVTEYETAKPALLSPKTPEGLLTAIRASILMPNLSNETVELDGTRYVDGCFSKPHIIKFSIKHIEATHILIFTSQDKEDLNVSVTEKILNNTLFRRRMSPVLRQAANTRGVERATTFAELPHITNVPYCLVWGNGAIHGLERDGVKVKKVIDDSKRWWKKLLQS